MIAGKVGYLRLISGMSAIGMTMPPTTINPQKIRARSPDMMASTEFLAVVLL